MLHCDHDIHEMRVHFQKLELEFIFPCLSQICNFLSGDSKLLLSLLGSQRITVFHPVIELDPEKKRNCYFQPFFNILKSFL
jgi:hypothetical protein